MQMIQQRSEYNPEQIGKTIIVHDPRTGENIEVPESQVQVIFIDEFNNYNSLNRPDLYPQTYVIGNSSSQFQNNPYGYGSDQFKMPL